MTATLCLALLIIFCSQTWGFLIPTSKSTVATHANIFPELQDFTESCTVAYQHPSASSSINLSLDMIQMNEMTSGLAGTIRTVAVVITALLFGLFGLTLITASAIIPPAAKFLEEECKELDPDLWEEYQQKLNPGEEISNRPELMMELGTKIQPLLDAKMAVINAEISKLEEKDGMEDDNN